MIYLDNAATTKPKFFRKDFYSLWLNSNSSYTRSYEQHELHQAEEKIKKCLNVKSGYVLFFRCATEAIEWLSKKTEWYFFDCPPYSHDSVYNLIHKNPKNIQTPSIYCDQLINPITGDFMADISNYNFNSRWNCFVGCDYTAAIGHINLPIHPKYDFIFFSGHKFYTEKGIGAMWISDTLGRYLGASTDSKNQYNLVHGTVDVQGVLMLSNAMEYACNNINLRKYGDLLLEFSYQCIENNIENHILLLTNNWNNRTSAINAIHLQRINADALQTYLASKSIYIGTAHSACSGESDYRVLESMDFNKETASETIRISFGIDNTSEEIVKLVQHIKNFKEMF